MGLGVGEAPIASQGNVTLSNDIMYVSSKCLSKYPTPFPSQLISGQHASTAENISPFLLHATPP